LFEHVNLHGAHKHVFIEEANLNRGGDNFFNDRISSFVIIEGKRTFWRGGNFSGPKSATLGPGVHNWTEGVGVPNDQAPSLSSIRHQDARREKRR
jgi:hypothetical protein